MNTVESVPAFLEWNVYKGDTARLNIILRDESNKEMDLSEYEFAGQVKASPKDNDSLQEITIVKSNSVLTLTLQDTSTLPRKSYFDIQSTNANGDVQTILKGNINAEDDVTR